MHFLYWKLGLIEHVNIVRDFKDGEFKKWPLILYGRAKYMNLSIFCF